MAPINQLWEIGRQYAGNTPPQQAVQRYPGSRRYQLQSPPSAATSTPCTYAETRANTFPRPHSAAFITETMGRSSANAPQRAGSATEGGGEHAGVRRTLTVRDPPLWRLAPTIRFCVHTETRLVAESDRPNSSILRGDQRGTGGVSLEVQDGRDYHCIDNKRTLI
jgi:hypothetical protein